MITWGGGEALLITTIAGDGLEYKLHYHLVLRIVSPNSRNTKSPHPKCATDNQPLPRVLHCLHCRSSEGNLKEQKRPTTEAKEAVARGTSAMTSDPGGGILLTASQGLPDDHVTLKNSTMSKVQSSTSVGATVGAQNKKFRFFQKRKR